ncbi:MAG: hypothetical protein ACUZ8O_12975 [Candidatus Anammoxibacter sp.]
MAKTKKSNVMVEKIKKKKKQAVSSSSRVRTTKNDTNIFPIVGIGASAGGLAAGH